MLFGLRLLTGALVAFALPGIDLPLFYEFVLDDPGAAEAAGG
jgi:hypothetical protein